MRKGTLFGCSTYSALRLLWLRKPVRGCLYLSTSGDKPPPKIYTRTGDKGRSALFTGERRAKNDLCFHALGDIDELSSCVGLSDALSQDAGLHLPVLREVQCVLQDVAAAVATPPSSARDAHLSRVQLPPTLAQDLEAHIDSYSHQLPPLTNFILPSGGVVSSSLHVARSVCRRAERSVTPLLQQGEVGPEVASYLNRLSDLLFTLARHTAASQGRPEYIYKKVQRHVLVNPTTRTYSTSTSTQASDHHVTLSNIFSDMNRERVRGSFSSVRAIRGRVGTDRPRVAGVLVPLCVSGGEAGVLLTLRSRATPTHRGEVSFPGGMFVEDTDVDVVATALRECEEELGLATSRVEVWGQMPPVPSRDGKMSITPVVAYLGQIDMSTLTPCDKEVEEVFCASVESLCDTKNHASTSFKKAGYTLPVFLGCRYRIWGLTAIILHQTLSVLAAPGLYTRHIHDQH